MEKAIRRAIEGGMKEGEKWKFIRANRYWAGWLDGNGTETNISVDKYLLDPTFWECLAKSLSFGTDCGFVNCPAHGEHKKCWMKVWHSFIDHIADGKDIDSFFEQLIK